MTDSDKLKLLKAKDNEQETDEALSAALLTAWYAIMTRRYPFAHSFDNLEFPSEYDMLHIDIANIVLKKSGIEGETVHLENGIHRHYESADIPSSMLSVIVPKVGTI